MGLESPQGDLFESPNVFAGLDYLAAFVDAAEFPVLGACNMDTSGEPLLNGKIEKWATFELEGKNVAVLGYTNVEESEAMASLTGNLQFYDEVRHCLRICVLYSAGHPVPIVILNQYFNGEVCCRLCFVLPRPLCVRHAPPKNAATFRAHEVTSA